MPDPAPDDALVIGVDGARQGWVGVAWRGPGTTISIHLAPTLVALVDAVGPVAVIAVDMPVGLADAPGPGRRACDVAVRPLLGPRRSSLFPPPLAGALELDTYAAANAWSKRACGVGLSKQAWMLAPRIREVRAFVRETGRPPVHETFPELSFAAMAGAPMPAPKRSWNGLAGRVALLADHGLHLPRDAGPPGLAGADDVVDAAACAWSAARIRDGVAEYRPAHDRPPVERTPPVAGADGVVHDRRPTIWW